MDRFLVMVNEQLLALRLVYFAKLYNKNRAVWSERSLKKLAGINKEDDESLTISYLNRLKGILETKGYFWGKLKQGGYGLLAIYSIKGAESFEINVELVESLDEKTLRKEIKLLTSRGSDRDQSLTNKEVCELLWDLLTELASKHETINYNQLPVETGVKGHRNIFTWPIKIVKTFCKQANLPTLTVLITKKYNGLNELEQANQKESSVVFACSDWRDKSDDFGVFLDTVINEAGAYQTKDIEQLFVELVSTKERVKIEQESDADSISKDEP